MREPNLNSIDRDQHATTSHVEAKGVDRRTVITTAGVIGVGVFGAVTLTGCGGASDSATPTAAGNSSTSAGEQIKAAEIPVGGGKVFEAEKVVVTQPTAGEFKAFSAVCTHKGCTVKTVQNGTINCPCHGSKYDMTTGAVTAGPAPAPLGAKTVTVSGGSITVS
jgi:Rieske Fe-S protein